ncbi:MAG: UxaA family hydrolase [Verrucomicrobia bacterium]|nr:UxaA family hydrolase [Verrucomicrobiota bacterium]
MASSDPAAARAVRIHPSDNVATLLDDARPGIVQILGAERLNVTAVEPVAAGHKIALHAVAKGDPVLKYGFPIGHAVRALNAGEWVHLHNLASNYDERSSSLDVDTGAPTDTAHAYR